MPCARCRVAWSASTSECCSRSASRCDLCDSTWRSCPSRHAQRLLMFPRQTTPGTATPSNLPDRHYLCRSGVMDTGTHFDRCHLRERGRHLAIGRCSARLSLFLPETLSYPSLDPRQCVGRLCLVEQAASPSQLRSTCTHPCCGQVSSS